MHYFIWMTFVIFETVAQLWLKMASGGGSSLDLQSVRPIVNSPLFFRSIACDGVSLVVGLAILRRHDLSVAVPLTSMTYFAVLLAATLPLHEPVRSPQLMGLLLVGLGVTPVSRSESQQDNNV